MFLLKGSSKSYNNNSNFTLFYETAGLEFNCETTIMKFWFLSNKTVLSKTTAQDKPSKSIQTAIFHTFPLSKHGAATLLTDP